MEVILSECPSMEVLLAVITEMVTHTLSSYPHNFIFRQLVGVRLVVMVAFCIQGDNIQDAITMAGRLHSWMDINQKVILFFFCSGNIR